MVASLLSLLSNGLAMAWLGSANVGLMSMLLVHSVTFTAGVGRRAKDVTGATWPVISVAERSGSALRSSDSAYINMKNQCVNEHTSFRVPKLPPVIAQAIELPCAQRPGAQSRPPRLDTEIRVGGSDVRQCLTRLQFLRVIPPALLPK